jgi:DNA replicative helicase MCM subunit Mcm2 (Cdc46/Mcm family)
VCITAGAKSLIDSPCICKKCPTVVPSGQTPATLSACLYDELRDVGKAGDRVVVTGVWRCVPVRVDPRKRVVKKWAYFMTS